MKLDGKIVFNMLTSKGVSHLYHANTVRTASSFAFAGGLLSREMIEINNFVQTEQYTDLSDKNFGIWNDIFLDTVDYHQRIKNRNKYGPVLFEMELNILLLDGVEVKVTRLNPSKWSDYNSSCWYFDEDEEFDKYFRAGVFDYIVTLHNFSDTLTFYNFLSNILIDCPSDSSRWREFCWGVRGHLLEKSRQGGVFVLPQEKVRIRDCAGLVCGCLNGYSSLSNSEKKKMFCY